ncbi:Hypothetical protein KVN_LOCUS45 [uncultured virus]|nr:Hypothetical protein KVN_LOCUS45 [uncultured virus]
MNFYKKYLKYKNKYLHLKQIGGNSINNKSKPDVYDNKQNNYNQPSLNPNKYKNKIKKGIDEKNFYLSIQDNNGNYKWKLLKTPYETETPEEYYNQFPEYYNKKKYEFNLIKKKLENVTNELIKKDIYFVNIKWKDSQIHYDEAQNAAERYLREKFGIDDPKYNISNEISYIYLPESAKFLSEITGQLILGTNVLENDIKIVNSMFKEHFGDKFKWKDKRYGPIIINL